MAEKPNIRCIELKNLHTYISKSGNNKWQLRIVEYEVNGKTFPPKLEKRQFYKTVNGWHSGRNVGLNYQDVRVIHENYGQIEVYMTPKKEPF